MDDRAGMGWKGFTISLIEILRWPVAWVIIFFLLREPIGRLIGAFAGKLSG